MAGRPRGFDLEGLELYWGFIGNNGKMETTIKGIYWGSIGVYNGKKMEIVFSGLGGLRA